MRAVVTTASAATAPPAIFSAVAVAVARPIAWSFSIAVRDVEAALATTANASVPALAACELASDNKPAELACMSVPANGVFFDVAGPCGENASARTG